MSESAQLVSAIPAAQDNLARQLEGRSGFGKKGTRQAVRVSVGYPSKGMRNDDVWISGVIDDWEQEWSTTADGAPAGIDETFTLHVLFFVKRKGDDYPALRAQITGLVAELQAQLRDDITLDGAVQLATITSGGNGWDEGVDASGRSAFIDVPVHCEAYLTPNPDPFG